MLPQRIIKLLILTLLPITILHAKVESAHQPLNMALLQQSFDVQKRQSSQIEQVTLIRKGKGRNNVVQGLALDASRQTFYTLQLTGKNKLGVINRFSYSTKNQKITAKDAQLPSNSLGHQGITVDPRNGMLWSTAHSSIKDAGWKIVGFQYQANGLPKTMDTVQLFNRGYSHTAYTMPVITPDAKYLVVRGRKEKQNLIRVFELAKVDLSHGKDLSQSYQYEWDIDADLTKNKYAFQAMTSDGKYVYLFSGGLGKQHKDDKRLYVYTLQGKLVQKIDPFTVGKYQSLNYGEEGHWEPEGLAIDPVHKQLLVMYAIGDKGKRLARIYKIPIQYQK